MTMQDFVKKMAEDWSITQVAAKEMSLYVLNECKAAADATGRIQMGKHIFITKERAARKGRNPSTGEEILIPSKSVTKYKYTG